MESLKELWSSLLIAPCWSLTTSKCERGSSTPNTSLTVDGTVHTLRADLLKQHYSESTLIFPFLLLGRKTVIKMRLWSVVQRAWATAPDKPGLSLWFWNLQAWDCRQSLLQSLRFPICKVGSSDQYLVSLSFHSLLSPQGGHHSQGIEMNTGGVWSFEKIWLPQIQDEILGNST